MLIWLVVVRLTSSQCTTKRVLIQQCLQSANQKPSMHTHSLYIQDNKKPLWVIIKTQLALYCLLCNQAELRVRMVNNSKRHARSSAWQASAYSYYFAGTAPIWLANTRGKMLGVPRPPNKSCRECQPIKWERYLWTRRQHRSLRVSQGKKLIFTTVEFDFLPPWILIFTTLEIDFLPPWKLISTNTEIDFYYHGNWFLLPLKFSLHPWNCLVLFFLPWKFTQSIKMEIKKV